MLNLLNNVLNHMMYKSYYHYNLYMGPYNFNMYYYLNIKLMYILYNMLLIHNTQPWTITFLTSSIIPIIIISRITITSCANFTLIILNYVTKITLWTCKIWCIKITTVCSRTLFTARSNWLLVETTLTRCIVIRLVLTSFARRLTRSEFI
jgi:hypothetical protein